MRPLPCRVREFSLRTRILQPIADPRRWFLQIFRRVWSEEMVTKRTVPQENSLRQHETGHVPGMLRLASVAALPQLRSALARNGYGPLGDTYLVWCVFHFG